MQSVVVYESEAAREFRAIIEPYHAEGYRYGGKPLKHFSFWRPILRHSACSAGMSD
jgi:hypothetical protein